MRSSRLRFKYTLRICRQNEQAIRANAHAKALLEKDMLSFWKGVKKENNSRLPLSSKVNNCVGEENICKMWQTHYQMLLNSVKTTEHKERVLIETSETSNSSQITFTPIDISNAFKSLKIGKACGVDQGWGQVQLTKYSSTPSTPNIYQVQVLVKYSFF